MMFTNILFLILALLLISSNASETTPWIKSEWNAFAVSLLLYLLLTVLIVLQYIGLKGLLRKYRNGILILVNIELLLYLIIYQFILDAGRIFALIPYGQNMQTLNAIWELILYFGGLAILHCVSFDSLHTQYLQENRAKYAFRQLCLLLPFAIPFIFLTFIYDLFNALTLSNQIDQATIEVFTMIFSGAFIVLIFIFLPYIVQKIWLCKPLPEGMLKDRLHQLCLKANFKHAGMKTWTIMQDQLTAGIIGIVPRFRYVMFTDRILNELPPDNIEAILAHEIGHNKHHHLLLYPFILSGMIACASLFFHFFSDPLANFLEQQNAMHPNLWWDLLNPLFVFTLYACIIALYFRVVFGYFSRLFERQADLYIFKLGIFPDSIIHALETVGIKSGTYDTPNWHHYSIKQRIEFLKKCEKNPFLIIRHDQKVKRALLIFFCFLTISVFLLI